MEPDPFDRLFEKYVDSLSTEEAFAKLPPDIREKVAEDEVRTFRRYRRRPMTRLCAYGAGALSLAACLVFFLWPRVDGFGLTVRISANSNDPFTLSGQAEPLRSNFWVGVEVSRPCWIHVVERVESRHLIAIRERPQSDEYGVYVTSRAIIGPFNVIEQNSPDGPARVTHLLVIAAERLLTGENLATSTPHKIPLVHGNGNVDAQLRECADSLEREYGWQVFIQAIPKGSGEP